MGNRLILSDKRNNLKQEYAQYTRLVNMSFEALKKKMYVLFYIVNYSLT